MQKNRTSLELKPPFQEQVGVTPSRVTRRGIVTKEFYGCLSKKAGYAREIKEMAV
jgi:hypothetical protein